jgi:hypothetical protein
LLASDEIVVRPRVPLRSSRQVCYHTRLAPLPYWGGLHGMGSVFYPRAPMQCRALAQPQRSDRWAHGRGTPPTAGQYPLPYAQRSGVPFHQAPCMGSEWRIWGPTPLPHTIAPPWDPRRAKNTHRRVMESAFHRARSRAHRPRFARRRFCSLSLSVIFATQTLAARGA